MADGEQHSIFKEGQSESQDTKMIKQTVGLTGGRFTLGVITTTGLEMGPRGTESIFVKLMK